MAMNSIHDGHRERMRNRYFKNGLSDFEPHEALEMLLYFTTPRKDTNEIAHELIQHFGSFSAVMSASSDELRKVKGIGDQAAMLISMILPLHRMYLLESDKNIKHFNTSEQCGIYLQNYFSNISNEIVVAMLLDGQCKLLAVEEISNGINTVAPISPKRLLEVVLKHNASSVVLSHNHPGGLPLPSRPDIQTTIRIKELLDNIGVKLLDHIIVGADDYVAMALSKEYKSIFTGK